MQRLLLIIFLLPLSSFILKETERNGKVIKIKDGDTIAILYQGKSLTVRLADIDCPEKKQPYGNAARQFTAASCFGQEVTVTGNQFDRNKRLIGTVINAGGENLNQALVKAGLAWHYKKYSSDSTYAALESYARATKKGLWKDPHPVAPWQWRSTPPRRASR